MSGNTKWKSLHEKIFKAACKCRACDLCKFRAQVVPGTYNTSTNSKPTIMFIGEAPGKNEDAQGQPFCGRAGEILTTVLKDVDLIPKSASNWAAATNSSIYITNVVKCRPPKNRTPRDEEILQCSTFLRMEFQLIRPKLVVLLGTTAVTAIKLAFNAVGKFKRDILYRHIDLSYNGKKIGRFPIIHIYHPAYVLRKGGASEVLSVPLNQALVDLNLKPNDMKGDVECLLENLF